MTVGVLCGRTQRFLLPWRARLEAVRSATVPRWAMPAGAHSSRAGHADSAITRRHVPPTDPLPPANPPSDPVPAIPPPEVDVEIDYAKIVDLVIERMKADPEPFRGPAGLAGLQVLRVPGPQVRPVQDRRSTRTTGKRRHPCRAAVGRTGRQKRPSGNRVERGRGRRVRLPPVVLEIETPDGKVHQQAKPLGHPIRSNSSP